MGEMMVSHYLDQKQATEFGNRTSSVFVIGVIERSILLLLPLIPQSNHSDQRKAKACLMFDMMHVCFARV